MNPQGWREEDSTLKTPTDLSVTVSQIFFSDFHLPLEVNTVLYLLLWFNPDARRKEVECGTETPV